MTSKKSRYRDKNDYIDLPSIPEQIYMEFKKSATAVNSYNEDLHKKLTRIYEFVDTYNQFVDTFSVCEKGCAYCCHIEVFASDLEIGYIVEKAGINKNIPKKNNVSYTSKCPFLDQDNICTIYEYRPFGCRTFHALDNPKYCKKRDVEHQVYGVSGGRGIPMLEAFNIAIKQLNGNGGSGDIREYFSK